MELLIQIICVYLIGVLIGFGISYTASSFEGAWSDIRRDSGMSRYTFITICALLSWLTMLVVLHGIWTGLTRGGDDED